MVKNPKPPLQCVKQLNKKSPYTKLDKDSAWDLICELHNGELWNERSTTLKELKEEDYEDCDIAWAQDMMKVIDRMIGIGIKGVSRD
jgi:hypothetical protein